MRKNDLQAWVARHAARIVRKAKPASQGGFVLEWIGERSCFVAVMSHDNVDWSHGYTACQIPADQAVAMELLIAEKTAPIIHQLQATAGATPSGLRKPEHGGRTS